MTTRQAGALISILGGVATVAGVSILFGLPGGLIAAGLLLVAAGASES